MNKPIQNWLILDMSFLAHRAFYSTGGLKHQEAATGTTFGILRDIQTLSESFNTNNIVYCFDGEGDRVRKTLLPTYKESRRKKREAFTPQEAKTYQEMQNQLTTIRKTGLPSLGIKNIYHIECYEADDLIALVKAKLRPDPNNEIIIVSADEDLYQLLDAKTIIYNPRTKLPYTLTSFQKEYWNLSPQDWPLVKAIAGCRGDDVPGIDGVGDKTAAKYLSKGSSGRFDDTIKDWMTSRQYQLNLKLVKLPFASADIEMPQREQISKSGWDSLAESLGMRSIRGKAPVDRKVQGGFNIGI